MKPVLLCSVSLWTLLVFSAALEICREECVKTFTTTSTTVTFGSIANCNIENCTISIGNKVFENGSISGLIPGARYEIFFKCFNCCREATTKPLAVRNLTDTNITTSSISLKWTKPEGNISFYKVQWIDGDVNKTTGASMTITGLTPGVKFSISVTAVADDEFTEGEKASVSLYTRPGEIGELSVSTNTSSISLNWTLPPGEVFKYRLKWHNGGALMTVCTNSTFAVLSGLIPGSSYTISVIAVAGDNLTEGHPHTFTSVTKPEVVSNITFTEITTSSLSLKWTKPEGNSSFYRVRWTDGNVTGSDNVTQTNITITKLTAGVQYKITVTAVTDDGSTDGQSTTVSQYTKPEVVSGIVAIGSTTTFTVSWTSAVGQVVSYTVLLYRDGHLVRNSKDLSNTTVRKQFQDVTPGVLYCVAVVTKSGPFESTSSNVSNATFPNPPGPIMVESQTVKSINFTWASPEDMEHNQYNFSVSSFNGSSVTRNNWFLLDNLQSGSSNNISVVAVGALGYESTAVTTENYTRPGEIGELSVSTNTSSISLNWTSPPGEVFKYRLKWHNGGALMTVCTNSTFAVLSGLIPGSSYTISVIAVAGDNLTEGHPHTFTSVTKPEVVSNITFTEITTSSLSLKWNKPEGNSSFYRVRWTDGNVTGSDNVTQTNITITKLTAGVQYEITFTAVTDDGSTDGQSTTVSQYTRPGEIGELSVSTNTSSISLNWTSPPGEVFKYRLKWHNGGALMTVCTNSTFAVLSGLIPGSSYTISVIAVAGDNLTEGHPHTFTSVTKPEVVSNITFTEITTSSLSLKWNKPEGNGSFYRVRWTDGNVTGSDNVTQTNITITKLTAGVQYEITFTAVTDDGSTDGQSTTVSQYTRPGEIGELSVSTNTSSISLNWTSPPGEVFKYRLKWHNGGALMTVCTNSTFAVLSGLIPGSSYTISVIAVAGDNLTEGHPHTFTSVTKPEVVSNITFTEITTSSLSLKWNKPEGNGSFYRVRWTDGNVTGSDNVTQTNITITKLTAGVQYEITFTAVTDDGSTDGQSTTVSQYTRPGEIGELSVSTNTSSISLNWTSPPGEVFKYRLKWHNGGALMTVCTNSTFAVLSGLIPGSSYTISVIAVAGDNLTEGHPHTFTSVTKPKVVSNITFTEITTSSLSLKWNKPEGNSSFYRVRWTDGNVTGSDNVTQTNITITKLTAGVQYEITVTAVTDDGSTEGQSTTVSQYTRPGEIGELSVSTNTSSISLNWTLPPGEVFKYRLKWHNGGALMTVCTNSTFAVLSGLIPGSSYTISVIAVAGDNLTEGHPHTFTSVTKPEVVSNITFTEITTSSLSLKWNKPEGNSSFYRVRWTDGNVTGSDNVTQTNITITKLTAGVQYEITFTAVTDDGSTDGQSTTVSQYTRPGEIGELSVSTNTSSISLNWTSPPGEVFKYRLKWHNGGALMTVCTNSTFAVLSGLIPGSSYTISVIAVAGDNLTEGHPHTFTSVTKPEVVSNITFTEITTSSLSLKWNKPEGNSSFYRVRWTDGNVTGSDNVTQTNITITKLTAGVQYKITVTAVTDDGSTDGQSTTVFQYTRPGEIGKLSVSTNTSSISLNWTSPPGEVFKYRLKWHNGGTLITVCTNSTFAVLSGLIPGSSYTISVIAVAGDNRTEGHPHTFTSVTKPSVVRNLSISDVTTSSVFLNWTEPDGNATSYTVQWTLRNDTFSNTTTETSFTINDLDPGVKYNFTVTAVAVLSSNKGEGILKSSFTRPEQPEDIMVTERGTSYLNISWNLPRGRVDHYVVNILNDGHIDLYSNTTAVTTALFTDLNPGRLFFITVTAVAGSFTNTFNQSSFATEPTPPGSIIISQRTSSLHLTWATPALMEGAPHISYIITYQPEGVEVQNRSTLVNTTELSSLVSGTSYNITVETVGPQHFRSTAVHDSAFTLPNPVLNLTASPKSTTSIQVKWSDPREAKLYYKYLVQTYSAGALFNNITVNNNSTDVTNLEPGTGYNIDVTTIAAKGSESSVEQTFSYTKPEVVSGIVAIGSTTTFTVSWTSAVGQVVSYTVLLYRDGHLVRNSKDLSNTTVRKQFQDVTPGVLYCVAVVTKSGPFESTSSNVSNATFPNPPGPIMVESQTVKSINFTWASPEDMEHNQYNFSVSSFNGSSVTRNNWFLLDNLQSGSSNNISVVAVGALGYESTAVTTENYTRPYSVTKLRQTEITTNAVTLEWEQHESKSHYSYLVETTNGSFSQLEAVLNQQKDIITGLLSGSNYSFTVTTQTPDGTQAAPVTVSYFTRPYSIGRFIESETLNTTAVRLVWTRPMEYKSEYTYWVQTTGCGSKNKTFEGEEADISELTPGTNCTFCVFVRAADDIEGKASCTSQYTKPEAVQPNISSLGSNSSIRVSWNQPPGNVEHYKVYLYSTSTAPQEVSLNSTITDFPFRNLSAGSLYTAVVTTCSGPFNASSGFITNATYPNAPGPIDVLTKTNRSIDIRWKKAPLMTGATFHYQLTSHQGGEDITTTNTSHSFTSLLSGTSYNISVATVGAMGFKSEKVQTNMVTTRPFSVKRLTASTEEESIAVMWHKPDEYKESYRYNVTWHSTDGPISDRLIKERKYNIDNLDPGKPYNISVTTETLDETKGASIWISNCTNASPAKNLDCKGLNTANAQVILTCNKPNGQYSGFKVTVKDGEINTTHTCNHTVSNLRHNIEYFLTVETQSCGLPSTPEYLRCRTGITNPPIPENYESLVVVSSREYNKFTLQIKASLLNRTNGPITHIGVLVTDDPPGDTSNLQKYVGKTHKQWQEKDTPVYMATVEEIGYQSRSGAGHLNIEIGDRSEWEDYINGALEANGKYLYAIVLFTSLDLQNHLVNDQKSLISITNFYPAVALPQNPVIIGIATGVTLGMFCILIIILIGFVIYWKRLSHKESPDIQIHAIRAKVSVAVRVEEYEAYYKKQKADSNCGFAEEFEDLKLVGTAQMKTNAQTLENKPKNRYNNVLPYDSSRVKLSIIHGSPYDDYINANYMPGYNSRKEYIAAQGPLPTSVSDFWRMIWEKNVQTLVMLTRCNEQGRVKCEQYWDHGTRHFENITVTTTSEIQLEDWTIRDFDIRNVKTAESRSVRHFHFTAWPDHGVPQTTELLISFRHLVREHMDQYSRHSPTVVHCSAGVGRTGTFIAIDRLIFQIERENVVDLYGIIHDLRMHRPLMVQTEDQYVFLNQCAMDIIRSRTGTNVDLIYQNSAAFSIYENINTKSGYHNALP